MTVTQTGYEKDNLGVWIKKDPQASLPYSMDWSEWLPVSDTLQTVTYSLQVRANDPSPLTKVAEGITGSNKITYVTLSGGQAGKIYTVTAHITTNNGLIDERYFRVKVEERSA